MSSSDMNIGVASTARPSSRVLKPPGGGHSNIFAEPEISVNAPRPKYNQQNSSNLIACVGATDPNQVVEKLREEIEGTKQQSSEKDVNEATSEQNSTNSTSETNNKKNNNANINESQQNTRGRVPPGGYSSGGFW